MGGGLHVACACLQGDGLRHETTLMGGEGEHCFHLLDSGRGILGTVRYVRYQYLGKVPLDTAKTRF